MKKSNKKTAGVSPLYQAPEVLSENVLPENGFCGSGNVDGGSNESIGDDKEYEFNF